MFDGSVVASTALFQNPSFATLNLTLHVLKLPTRWYAYKAIKQTYQAELFATKALERDLWLQLAEFYYKAQRDRQTLKDLTHGLKHLKENHIPVPIEQKEQLILQYLDLTKLTTKEEAELRSMLNDTKQDLWGKEPPQYEKVRDHINQISSVENFVENAIDQSYAVRNLNNLIDAAKSMVSSEKFSILMLTGLGIGYWESVEISQSKVGELQVKLDEAKRTIRSQIYASLQELRSNLKAFEIHAKKWNRNKENRSNSFSFEDWQANFRQSTNARNAIVDLYLSCAKFAHHVGYEYHGTCQLTPPSESKHSSKKYSIRHELNPDKSLRVWLETDFEGYLEIKSVNYKWGYFRRSQRSGSYAQKFQITIPEAENKSVEVTVKFWHHPNVVIDLQPG